MDGAQLHRRQPTPGPLSGIPARMVGLLCARRLAPASERPERVAAPAHPEMVFAAKPCPATRCRATLSRDGQLSESGGEDRNHDAPDERRIRWHRRREHPERMNPKLSVRSSLNPPPAGDGSPRCSDNVSNSSGSFLAASFPSFEPEGCGSAEGWQRGKIVT